MSILKKAKPVIALDSGKVLVDFNQNFFSEQLTNYLGRPIDSEFIFKLDSLIPSINAGMHSWEDVLPSLGDALGRAIDIVEWRDFYNRMINDEVPGMYELLVELKKKFQIVALSNTDEIHWSYLLEQFPIFGLLDGWVVSFQEKAAKPNPAIYRKLMDRYCNGKPPFFFTDDIDVNVESALSLGWKAEVFINARHLKATVERIAKTARY